MRPVHGMTPWARRALATVDTEPLEALVPDGYHVGISAERKPGRWALWLYEGRYRTQAHRAHVPTGGLARGIEALVREAGLAA